MPPSSNPVHEQVQGQRSDARNNVLRRVIHTVKTKVANTKKKLTDKISSNCRIAKIAMDYTLEVIRGEKLRGFLKRCIDREPLYPIGVDVCDAFEDEIGRLFDILLEYVNEKGANDKRFYFLGIGLAFIKDRWTNAEDKRWYIMMLLNLLTLPQNQAFQAGNARDIVIVVLVYLYSALKAKDERVAQGLMAELAVRVSVTMASGLFPRDGYVYGITTSVFTASAMDFLRSPEAREAFSGVLQFIRSRFTNGAGEPLAADGDD
jgi:hypothetical protein